MREELKMAKGNGAERKPDDKLVDLIFSWSLQDVMNQELFRDKVWSLLHSCVYSDRLIWFYIHSS